MSNPEQPSNPSDSDDTPAKPPIPGPAGTDGEGERYIEIVIRLSPIDPELGKECGPLEATRETINATFEKVHGVRRISEHDEQNIAPEPLQSGRAKVLADDAVREVEEPLAKLAAEAFTATKKFMVEASARAAAKIIVETEGRLNEAVNELERLHREVISLWDRCVPTREECIKDIVKYAIRAAVVFAAYSMWQAASS